MDRNEMRREDSAASVDSIYKTISWATAAVVYKYSFHVQTQRRLLTFHRLIFTFYSVLFIYPYFWGKNTQYILFIVFPEKKSSSCPSNLPTHSTPYPSFSFTVYYFSFSGFYFHFLFSFLLFLLRYKLLSVPLFFSPLPFYTLLWPPWP